MVWYSNLFQNFPVTVIHTVKGFGMVNKAEIDVFLELSCFFDDPVGIGNLISGSSAFSKTSLNIWKFSVHVLLKTLHMDITRWPTLKQTDYILCSQRWRSSIQSSKTRPGADCGSDNELLIAKFRLKLKKVGKTTRPFRYDLNQIPYDYTVEVRNRFKGLDLIKQRA